MTDDQTRSGFRLLPRGIEENYFKAVPGGWLVAVKRPHGSDWNHLVSDAQKPTIAARLRLAIIARFALFSGWFLVAIIGAGRSETPLVIFGLLLAFNACGYLSTRSVLRDLPLTSEPLTSRDQMRSRAAAMSVSALVTLVVMCLAAAAGIVAADLILIWPVAADKVTPRTVSLMLVSALWLGVAIYWLRLLAIKLHALRRNP
jgi:hypothetical protein